MLTPRDPRRPDPGPHRRRRRVAAAGVAAALACCGIVTGTATGAGAADATTSPGVRDVRVLRGAVAADVLRRAGIRVAGTPVGGWQWTDRNGRNILLQTRTITARDSQDTASGTLRVVHAAGIGVRPRVLRQLVDSQRCRIEFGMGFVPRSVTIADRDRNGAAEVTVGWYTLCRGDIGPFDLTLAVLHDGRYDVLHGVGQIPPGAPASYQIPKATFTASPAPARWPRGVYPATVALFHRLFV